MKITSLLAASALSLSSVASATSPGYHNPVEPEFPILAWYSILPDSALTPGRYAELRDAGFNISFSHFDNNDQIARALDASRGTGVKLMLTSWPLFTDTKATVERFRDDDGVAGWFLRDEPSAPGFKELADYRDRIYAADTTHLLYLNLLPSIVPAKDLGTKDYDQYVQRFIDEVDIPLVSYDFYPIVRDDSTGTVYWRGSHFENLEIASRVARRNGRPFWAFCLATAHHPYPVPVATHLRFEAFTALAYGAQGIQYFTYWQPVSKQWDFHHAPIDETGKRTDVYYLIRDLNREIQALAPVFLGAVVDDVSFAGPLVPQGCKALATAPEGFGKISVDGPGVLVSQLHNGDADYIMFVNHDIDHAQTVTVTRPAGLRVVNSDGTLAADPRTPSFTLAPGSYRLFRK